MGNDKGENVPKGFKRPGTNTADLASADWSSCNAGKLRDLVAMASKKRGALRLGYTRDGGAYAIGVYIGSDYFTDYVRPNEDIDQYLETLTESFREYEPTQENTPKARTAKK